MSGSKNPTVNAPVVIGSVSGKRNISSAMDFLLRNRICPVFTPMRKPFSQASIEGNNSVFSRKFWNRIVFSGIKNIDEKLEWFNEASLRYTGYKSLLNEREGSFMPRVYFIRQVREDEATKDGYIDVLNDRVRLPCAYINFFVLAQWDLTNENITVHLEKDETLETIEEVLFPVNKESKRRYPGWYTFIMPSTVSR